MKFKLCTLSVLFFICGAGLKAQNSVDLDQYDSIEELEYNINEWVHKTTYELYVDEAFAKKDKQINKKNIEKGQSIFEKLGYDSIFHMLTYEYASHTFNQEIVENKSYITLNMDIPYIHHEEDGTNWYYEFQNFQTNKLIKADMDGTSVPLDTVLEQGQVTSYIILDDNRYIDNVDYQYGFDIPTQTVTFSLNEKENAYKSKDGLIQFHLQKDIIENSSISQELIAESMVKYEVTPYDAVLRMPAHMYENIWHVRLYDQANNLIDEYGQAPASDAKVYYVSQLSKSAKKDLTRRLMDADELRKKLKDENITDVSEAKQYVQAYLDNYANELKISDKEDICYITYPRIYSEHPDAEVARIEIQYITEYKDFLIARVALNENQKQVYTVASDENSKIGLIKSSGDWLIAPEYENIVDYGSNFVSAVKVDGEMSFSSDQLYNVDVENGRLIPLNMTVVEQANERILIVSQNIQDASGSHSKYGLFDRFKGELVVPIDFDLISFFSNVGDWETDAFEVYKFEVGKDGIERGWNSIYNAVGHKISKNKYESVDFYSDDSVMATRADGLQVTLTLDEEGKVVER